jgi:hypothetical protein
LLLIVDDNSENIPNNVLNGAFGYIGDQGQQCDAYSWNCGPLTCSCASQLSSLVQNASDWVPFNVKISYFLSQLVPEQCQV